MVGQAADAAGYGWARVVAAVATAIAAGALVRAALRIVFGIGDREDPLLTHEPPEADGGAGDGGQDEPDDDVRADARAPRCGPRAGVRAGAGRPCGRRGRAAAGPRRPRARGARRVTGGARRSRPSRWAPRTCSTAWSRPSARSLSVSSVSTGAGCRRSRGYGGAGTGAEDRPQRRRRRLRRVAHRRRRHARRPVRAHASVVASAARSLAASRNVRRKWSVRCISAIAITASTTFTAVIAMCIPTLKLRSWVALAFPWSM